MWFAVCDADGHLMSTGTVADDDAITAKGWVKVEIDGEPGDRVWDAEARVFVQRPPEPREVLTKLEFIQRFTPPEFMAIRQSQDPSVQFMLYQIEQSVEVPLRSPTVTEGLAYLVSKGIIAPERADQIGAV